MLFLSRNNLSFYFSETAVWTKRNFKVAGWQARTELLPLESYHWRGQSLLLTDCKRIWLDFCLNYMHPIQGCTHLGDSNSLDPFTLPDYHVPLGDI